MHKTRGLFAAAVVAASVLIPWSIAGAVFSPVDGSNSAAAHMCQHGGYLSLVGADGTTFATVGACVSYAAHDGTFATGLVLPAGETATISGAYFGPPSGPACDALTYGYQLNLGANVQVDSYGGGCGGMAAAGATIGPFPTAVLLRTWLDDVSCGSSTDWVYYSDGGHALVTGSGPWTVDIMDSYFCTSTSSQTRTPPGPGQGNLSMTVTFS
jgi:hypothetical protein